MNDTAVLKKYAELLVHYCLRLQKEKRVLITSTTNAIPLLSEVYREIVSIGAYYDSRIVIPGETRLVYTDSPYESLGAVSPVEEFATSKYDALLRISAPFDKQELADIDPSRKKKAEEGRRVIRDIMQNRSLHGELAWTLCEFPAESSAKESGMSLDEYTRFVYDSCFLNENDPVAAWKNLSESQKIISEKLNSVKTIRYVAPETDISFSVDGRRWINSDGRRNMPSGEVFTSPVEDSVNGSIYFSYPGIFLGEEVSGVRLTVQNGRVEKWSAEHGAKLLDEVLSIDGARYFGEAAVGLNEGIKRFTKNTLFDEKMAGTVHMALGATYPETGGKNKSSIHWDLITDMRKDGAIYADGECIYKNGVFIW